MSQSNGRTLRKPTKTADFHFVFISCHEPAQARLRVFFKLGGHKPKRPHACHPNDATMAKKNAIQKDPRVLGEHPLAYLPIRTRVHGGARVKTMKRRLDNFARVPWIFSGATRARAGRARVLSRAMTARVPPRTRRKIFRTRRQSSSPVKRASRAPGPFAPADNYVPFFCQTEQEEDEPREAQVLLRVDCL